jgi:mono/diheme cytochrome c family protein
MNRIMPACAIAAVTLVTQFPILAQPVERDGISSGRQIAAKICGNCHEISPTMSPKTAVGPRFDDIANLPSTTALSLKVFLRSSHKRMRNLILSGADSDDVIAYIPASRGGSLTSPNPRANIMARFYQPDLSQNIDSPFVRDGDNKLIRRCYWLDIDDRTLVMMMVNGIG